MDLSDGKRAVISLQRLYSIGQTTRSVVVGLGNDISRTAVGLVITLIIVPDAQGVPFHIHSISFSFLVYK